MSVLNKKLPRSEQVVDAYNAHCQLEKTDTRAYRASVLSLLAENERLRAALSTLAKCVRSGEYNRDDAVDEIARAIENCVRRIGPRTNPGHGLAAAEALEGKP